MPSKRSVLEVLSAHELRAIVEEFELEPEDRRSRDALIDAVASSHKATLENVLPTLSRKTLKGICQELGLDDGGREKAVIVERILSGEGAAKDAGDEAEPEKASPRRGRPKKGEATPDVELPVPTKQLTRQQLEGYLWSAADILRGSIDSSDYKNYIFGLLFLKRLSDRFQEEAEKLLQ